ncbi:MAG: radical SAM protein [Smithella sp.]|jgi:pyrroloquinoline quinone biosynthesis protein E
MAVKEELNSSIKSNRALSDCLNVFRPKYRLLKRYVDFYTKDRFPPRHIQLEPTTKCNCNCIICGRNKSNARDLELTEFKRIISQIPSLQLVQLQGMGEPVLCEDFEDMVKFGVSRNIEFTTNSNATVLDDNKIELILSYFKAFYISFDSVIKENFERIRVGADFDKVLYNIRRLAARKKELEGKTKIVLYFVVTHLNYRELPLFFNLCEDLGFEAEVRECMNWMWLNPEHNEYQEAVNFISNCEKVRDDVKTIIKNRTAKTNVYFYQKANMKNAMCYWPFSASYITVDGFVTPCCMISDPGILNFGNIREKPFHHIWNSPEYTCFRKTHYFNLGNSFCDRCYTHLCVAD